MPLFNGNISKVRSSEETNIPLKFSLYAIIAMLKVSLKKCCGIFQYFCATALETLPNYEIYMEF
jgi:uncharacterized membrane protein (GlpM family)